MSWRADEPTSRFQLPAVSSGSELPAQNRLVGWSASPPGLKLVANCMQSCR
jgi:hypothetical protein